MAVGAEEFGVKYYTPYSPCEELEAEDGQESCC